MDMLPVDSSNLAEVGYDEDTSELRIHFHNGSTYSYAGVPQHVHEDLMNAPSVGKFFHAHIRSNYATTEV